MHLRASNDDTRLVFIEGLGQEYLGGDAINLAARMEQTAEPGTVRVAEETYKLVAPVFDFEALGAIPVKGKAEPVAAFRAIGRKAAMEMLLTGRYSPANEARELGLINRVVPLRNLETETDTLALQIADASRFVLAIGKQGFYAQVDQTDNNAMHYAKHTIAMNLSAKDAQHGIDSFLNKKTPICKDR